MIHKIITFEFVVPAVLAVVLGIVLSSGAVYLANSHLGPVDQTEADRPVASSRGNAEFPNRDFSRVHLLLSSIR